MKPPLIAITASPQAKGWEFSDRSLSLSLHYPRAVEAAGGVPLVLPLTTNRATLRRLLETVAGLILTGGGDVAARYHAPNLAGPLRRRLRGVDPLRDQMELELVRETLRRRLPLLAICRGHQVLNVALGGTLIVDIPSQVPGALRHRPPPGRPDAIHNIQITPDSRLGRILGRTSMAVNSFHHQAVDRPGRGLRISARAADGVIEGIETTDGSFAVGVQFHPERMRDRCRPMARLFAALVAEARRR